MQARWVLCNGDGCSVACLLYDLLVEVFFPLCRGRWGAT